MSIKLPPIHLIIWVILAFSSCSSKKTDRAATSIDTIPMLVMQIQQCSKLYTAEYKVHKIITKNDPQRISGSLLNKSFSIELPLGQRKVAIPIDATLKAYIDFKDFSTEQVHKKGQKIEIILPDPKVALTSTKIDHENIHQYVALTRSHFTDAELTDYEQQGRQAIINDIPKMGILQTAQDNAARTLIPIIQQLGYRQEDITITFRRPFGLKDIPSLLDITTHEKAPQ